MRQVPLIAVSIAAAALAGCGGAQKSNGSAAISAHAETPTEAAWRVQAQQFAHDLDTGLEALATTASTDSYAAVANLGPLAYCASNLEALGSAPPAYELARGSFEAACEELASGASLWQSEVNSNGQDFEAAAYAIRLGRRLLTRGEERLTLFQTKKAPLQGAEAERAELWARKIDRYWTAEIQGAFASVDRELRAGASNPIQALWDEHSGGDATTVGSCNEVLDRSVTSPPDAAAQHVLDKLRAACGALESATDISSFNEQAYEQAKAQMGAAIAALRVLAP